MNPVKLFVKILPFWSLMFLSLTLESTNASQPSQDNEAKAYVLLAGKDNAAAVFYWEYEQKLDPNARYILKRTLKWQTEDLESSEILHASEQIHYFKIDQQASYKRVGATQNLWRTEAYSAVTPVVDGKPYGFALQMPRLRRGVEPNEAQQKQIDEYQMAFSSKNIKGWLHIEDEFFMVNADFEGDFYKFPTPARSGPWTSDVYPLNPIHNLRRDYSDFLQYLHAVEIRSELPQEAIYKSKVFLEWKTGSSPSAEDFKIYE